MLNMEVSYSSETLVSSHKPTRSHNPESTLVTVLFLVAKGNCPILYEPGRGHSNSFT
jgi:hypothetical protein